MVTNNKMRTIGIMTNDKPLKYLYGILCTPYIMANPKNRCIKCLTKNENVLVFPPEYAKLLAALYTGRNEKIANKATIAHIKRSPFMLLNSVCIYTSQ